MNAVNSRKEEGCFGILGNTVSVNAMAYTWIKAIEFMHTQLGELSYPLLLRRQILKP